MSEMTATMRIFEPYPGLYAYYDGRIAGKRLHSSEPNWLDDGAYSLGIASYSFVGGDEALIYDTHMSIEHAQAIRDHVTGLGARNIRVVLSHWHTDHIAGNAAFADYEIIALDLTAETMRRNREKLESNALPIKPVIMPTRTFEKQMDLTIGSRRLELHHFDIHSADGCVIWLPDEQILLAGDTLEDTVTYISEPEHVSMHISESSRMATWPIRRILPNHGDPEKIAAGGYDKRLIEANRVYLQRLLDPEQRRIASKTTLKEFVGEETRSGAIGYFEPYEAVHSENISAMTRVAPG